MAHIPKRQSLPSQSADIIIQMISEGEFGKFLPGERELANRLQIGRDTLRAALSLLETQKVITRSEHGKRRQINQISKTKQKAQKHKRIGFLSPKKVHELPPWMLIELDTLRSLLAKRSQELDFISPGIFHLVNPASRLATIVEDSKVDLWILHQCPAPVQKWFYDNNIPILVRGYSAEGLELPCIDEDWEAAAFHAGGTLKRMGHTHIGLMMPDKKLAGLIAAEKGLNEAFIAEGEKHSISNLTDQGDIASTVTVLEKVIRRENPPTALVLTRTRQVLTVLSWLAQYRYRIPQDISIIALCYEPWFEHIVPKVAHYNTDPTAIARVVMRKITKLTEGEAKDTTRKLTIPDYIKGETIKDLNLAP